jgi:hypothetical protein
MAAFRVPPAPGGKATLGDRFRQLMLLPGVFGDPPPTTTTPMHQAWRWSLTALAADLAEILVSLDGPDWRPYIDIGRARGAQPVFVSACVLVVCGTTRIRTDASTAGR